MLSMWLYGWNWLCCYCDECYDSQDNELEQELANLKEENDKLNHAIKKLDLIIESDKFEGWSDQYHEMRQAIDSLKESNEKKWSFIRNIVHTRYGKR